MTKGGGRPDGGAGRFERLPIEEGILAAHPRVDDCVVARRPSTAGATVVAWVVSPGPIDHHELRAILDGPGLEAPAAIVPLVRVPRTDDGAVDLASLADIPCLDGEAASGWATLATAAPGVDDAAVLRRPVPHEREWLHLAQLIPGWTSDAGRADGPEPTGGAAETAAGEVAAATPAGRDDGPAALSEGGPLLPDPDRPLTLLDALERAARMRPDHGVGYVATDGTMSLQTYPSLRREALQLLGGLRRQGLCRGDRALLQLEDHRQFLTTFWACVAGGIVPVPVAVAPSYTTDSATAQKLHNAWELLGGPVILTDARHRQPIYAAGRDLFGVTWRVEDVGELADTDPATPERPGPDQLALMMLTSGSTGVPKAVTLTHANLIARSAGSVQLNGFGPEDVTLSWMPLDHVAGLLYFHLRDVFTGAVQLHAPTELVLQDPLRWIDWLDAHRVSVTFAPNFAFGLLNGAADRMADRTWDLTCVRLVLNGAEAIVARTARRSLELLIPFGLPATAMTPAWGMSETSSGVTYGDRFSLEAVHDEDAFVEVGRPIPGFAMRIVDEADQVLPEGTVGRLQVSGTTVTAGYFRPDGLQRGDFTADGWFNTGDLGTISDGRMTITGREKDVIIINGVNYYCHEIESVVEELAGVETSFTAACPVREPGVTTDSLAIFFHPRSTDPRERRALLREIRREVQRRVGITASVVIPVEQHEIPKTSIGKIQRPQLARELAEGRFDTALQELERLDGGDHTVPAWFFREEWAPMEAVAAGRGPGPCLVFGDADLAGDVWSVSVGGDFARRGPRHVQIDPGDPAHHARLLDELGALPTTVVQTWRAGDGATAEDTARLGVASVLLAVQALAERNPDGEAVRWIVAGPDDDLGAAAAIGLLRSARQELPWLSPRRVRFDEVLDPSALAIEVESRDGPTDVRWSAGRRTVPVLAPLDLAAPTLPPAFLPGGAFVALGGLGALGGLVLGHLQAAGPSRLLLLGRQPAGELDDEHRARLDELAAIGGDVRYGAVDVADPVAVVSAVEAALTAWGADRIDGVLHFAGRFHEATLADETVSGLEAVLRPKWYATSAIDALLARFPCAAVLACSSINGHFGGYGVGAYAAASAALDAWCDGAVARGHRVHCLAWSLWDEIGMSRGYSMKRLSAGRGYDAITAGPGLRSLDALARRPGRWLVGLDGTNPNIRRHRRDVAPIAETFVGGWTARGADDLREDLGLDGVVCDRFGTETSCRWQRLGVIPRSAGGEVAELELELLLDGSDTSTRRLVEPEGELETALLGIWKALLQRERISTEESFFDLGGDSVLIIQLKGQIADQLGHDIAVTDLFQHPTVRSLAAFLAGGAAEDGAADGHDRGARRRDTLLRRRESPART